MSKNKLRWVIRIFYFSCFLMIFSLTPARAQENDKTALQNFDYNNPELSLKKTPFFHYAYLLTNDYIPCMAAAKNNPNICAAVPGPNNCKVQVSYFWNFLGNLLSGGRITPKILSACSSNSDMKGDTEKCKSFGELLLKNDSSACGNDKPCQAIVAGDEKICSDSDNNCKDTVNFLKAVRNYNIKYCQSIKDVQKKWICIGGISADPNECQKCQGFSQFADKSRREMITNREEI